MFVELLLGVMANAGLVGFERWGVDVNISSWSRDGVAGWDAEPKRDRRHFSSPVGEDGNPVGDETEVEDEEDARLEVSSAPEDVTSWRGLEW